MAKNMKNWRILTAIALTAGVAVLWQNCSQVGFESIPLDLNTKVGEGGFVVEPSVPTTPTAPTTPNVPSAPVAPTTPPKTDTTSNNGSTTPGVSEGDADDDHSEELFSACGISVADIVINVESVHVHGQGFGFALDSQKGEVSLKKVAEEGLAVKSLAAVTANTIDLAVHEEGSFILSTDGSKFPLSVLPSQGKPGIRVRLGGAADLAQDGQYLLKLDELPVPRKFGKEGCRLDNNLSGSLH